VVAGTLPLTDADNVCLQLQYVVKTGQRHDARHSAFKDGRAASLDGHNRSIPKADGPMDIGVKLLEDTSFPSHMVNGP
jgi:hypothetical protein